MNVTHLAANELRSLFGVVPQGYVAASASGCPLREPCSKGPKVLIFDESTSSADPMTAEQLARTINALKGRVTILFIAPRAEVLADRSHRTHW